MVSSDEALSETGRGPSAVAENRAAVGDALPRPAEPKRKRHRRRRRNGGAPPANGAVARQAASAPAADSAPGRNARPSAPPRQRAYAALDLGTNNCRLLVAVPAERGFRVVDSFSRIVRLGEGIGHTRLLSEAAMERAIAALKVCRTKLERREVQRARLIATEACRLAENGPDFIARVREETGLELEIVSQETEARLAAAGCASLIDASADGAILFDIGGGSSELVWLDFTRMKAAQSRRVGDAIRGWQSLPLGVVSLSERHGGHHIDEAIFEAMVAEVAALLEKFPGVEALDAAVAEGRMHMIGTSGTVTTLAGIHLGLERYDRRRVDGLWMSDAQIGEMIDQLRAADYEARVANPCIGRDRADLVLAGCAILEAVRRRWRCERMRVADRGLREGILDELMSADRVWRKRRRRRRRGAGRPGNPAVVGGADA